MSPATCNHWGKTGISRNNYHKLEKQEFITAVGHSFERKSGARAMKIDWMNRDELSQAIPPDYTEWIGKQLLSKLKGGTYASL